MFFPPPPRPEPDEPDSQGVAVTNHALKLMSEGVDLDDVPARLMSDLGVDAETAARCVLGIRALQMDVQVREKQLEAERHENSMPVAGTVGAVIGALLFGAIRWAMYESGSNSSVGFIRMSAVGAMLGGMLGCWIARNLDNPADTR